MPEDGGDSEPDATAGDSEQRGNQQAPVLLNETSSMRTCSSHGRVIITAEFPAVTAAAIA